MKKILIICLIAVISVLGSTAAMASTLASDTTTIDVPNHSYDLKGRLYINDDSSGQIEMSAWSSVREWAGSVKVTLYGYIDGNYIGSDTDTAATYDAFAVLDAGQKDTAAVYEAKGYHYALSNGSTVASGSTNCWW